MGFGSEARVFVVETDNLELREEMQEALINEDYQELEQLISENPDKIEAQEIDEEGNKKPSELKKNVKGLILISAMSGLMVAATAGSLSVGIVGVVAVPIIFIVGTIQEKFKKKKKKKNQKK